MRSAARVVAAIGALLVVAGLAACSAEEPDRDGPWAAQFERARENAQSDFQRDVLADDLITDEEYRETRQRYLDCNAAVGIHVTFAERGNGYEFSPAPNAEQEAEELRCSAETISVIQALYEAIRLNPRNDDFDELTANCLRDRGVVDDAFTTADWKTFSQAFAAAAAVTPSGDATAPPSDLPTLPGGIPMDDPQVQACSTNPLGL